MEEYKNELLEDLIGGLVLAKRLIAPELDEELAERSQEDPSSATVQLLQSITSVMWLESYDRLGVVLRVPAEDSIRNFVPWSAVIELSSMEQ